MTIGDSNRLDDPELNQLLSQLKPRGAKTGCQIPDLAQNPWIVAQSVVLDPGIAALDHLGDGEKAVLSLGLLHPKGLLILDDLAARQTAEQNSLNLIGTLGILLAAKKQGHLNEIGPVLHDLTQHGFHLKLDLHNSILRRAGEPEI